MTATAQLTSNQKSNQLSKPEIEFDVMEEKNTALRMHMCEEKTTFLSKYDLTIVELGGRESMGLEAMNPNYIHTSLHTPLCGIFLNPSLKFLLLGKPKCR